MHYEQQGVRVSQSAHGLGVFSLRPFHSHQLIGPIDGQVQDDPQYESEYCMEFGKNLALEPAPPFRYLNHSCHPNCALVEVESRTRRTPGADTELWLEALAEIEPGDQMTIDYAWPAAGAIPCDCGEPDCRGWIVAADERDLIDRAKRLLADE
jgi:hypothetical protein